jgi:hypothetical protein
MNVTYETLKNAKKRETRKFENDVIADFENKGKVTYIKSKSPRFNQTVKVKGKGITTMKKFESLLV